MSHLRPHIRVLRAEAFRLRQQADALNVGKQTDGGLTIIGWLLASSTAKLIAADDLEVEEREQEAKVAK